ncbi:unnamed protein product [Effrenium voratum]|uniref:Uncharacterized protein n=1 Tax=Effrenium voratum TaxID=2562239 RepID=A0AA36IG35_9DINO|nr:unnamed protein product [Effrenium voratum]CAJ1424616.1 unnamed protein product [Effrenium voratum]|mmetsp:Transcript_7088/g.16978  ORF Transcript_7088/g.16978 Transcript_7088/m.16978 type:complete len:207 (+) Transcript_7088:27-647(+)
MQQHTWGGSNLPFLAVGRVKDSVTLAYYIDPENVEQQEQTQEVFQKLLKASSQKLAAGQRTRLQWNNGSVCCLMDEQARLLYCVVTSLLTYPERQAYQLLYDFRALVERDGVGLDEAEKHALNDKLREPMRDLVKKYEALQDPKVSSATITPPDTSSVPLHHQDAREMRQADGKKWLLLFVAVVVIAFILWLLGRSSGDGKTALIM